MKKQRVLVCSAWPYASGVPHLGNLVSSLLSGDVFSRYYRLRGHEVLYVSGSDAHGTRIEYEARLLGITPAELAARNHDKICSIIEGFGIEFDNYTTTESPVHKRFVQEIYLQMEANGNILTREEERAYCLNCGRFLADRFVTGTCPRCGAAGAMGNQCSTCGSSLITEYRHRDDGIGLPLGGVRGEIGDRPVVHIFVGSKADWVELPEDALAFEELPPDASLIHRIEG